jgi:hypothetical protein
MVVALFKDINLEPDVLSRFGAGVEDVRRRLHAVDAEGRLHVGADCAIAIWLLFPRAAAKSNDPATWSAYVRLFADFVDKDAPHNIFYVYESATRPDCQGVCYKIPAPAFQGSDGVRPTCHQPRRDACFFS